MNSLQLPAKYPQLPTNLIDCNGTLIWGIAELGDVCHLGLCPPSRLHFSHCEPMFGHSNME